MDDWHSKMVETNLREHWARQEKRIRAKARIDRVIASMRKDIDEDILRELLEGAIDEMRRAKEAERRASRRTGVA